MIKLKQMWWEKWLAKEDGISSGDSSGEEASKVTPTRGEDNLESGDGNPESDNCNLELGNYHPESGNRMSDSGNSNQVRRMTDKERSRSQWTSTWSSRSRQNSVHQRKTSHS
jgi:hypothetical protein